MGVFAHKDSWRQRVCSSHWVVLILMGLLVLVILSLVGLGILGHNYSTTLQKMQEGVKTSNRTLAAELAALQQKWTNNLKTLQKVDQMVKNLTEEARKVKSQFLDQIQKLQGSFRKVNCDLEDIKHKQKWPVSGCCPRGWHLFQQGCYWVSSTQNTFTEAKEDCEEKNAHLVVITSNLEEKFVLQLIKPHHTWIGLWYNGQAWEWLDGTPYTVHRIDRWSHLPYHERLYCTMMYQDGLWSNASCQMQWKWVCEKPALQ